jgi:hypothetical protein
MNYWNMRTKINLIIILFMFCIFYSCKTSAPIALTPEQQAVKILDNSQKTTLELMETHISVAFEQVTSVNNARIKAVELHADVAQLISYESYNGFVGSITYRFWKKKTN